MERPKRAPLGAAAGAGRWATPLPPGWARRSERGHSSWCSCSPKLSRKREMLLRKVLEKNVEVLIENDAGISASESVELVESVG